jgi:Insect cuticle protein
MIYTFCVIVVNCAPVDKSAEIIKYEYEYLPDNAYRFIYELSDGQFRDEYGTFIEIGGQKVLSVKGSYGYKDESGKEIVVRYTSDSDGFRASGDHLPDTKTDVLGPPLLQISPSLIATLTG